MIARFGNDGLTFDVDDGGPEGAAAVILLHEMHPDRAAALIERQIAAG
jgi:hypothetical protein